MSDQDWLRLLLTRLENDIKDLRERGEEVEQQLHGLKTRLDSLDNAILILGPATTASKAAKIVYSLIRAFAIAMMAAAPFLGGLYAVKEFYGSL